MSVETQIERIKANISNAYASAEAKGATIPEVKNSENLASCVDSISGGGGSATFFGLTMPQIAGYLAEDGRIQYEKPVKAPDFSGLTEVGTTNGRGGLDARFWGFDFEEGTEIVFPDLLSIYGMRETFYNSDNVSNVTFSVATEIIDMQRCFWGTTGLTEVNFPEVTVCRDYGLFNSFTNCSDFTTFNAPKLASISTNSMGGCFTNCTSLTTILFPALTTVSKDSFGTTYIYAFSGCTKLLEIHFRADAQTAIEAMTGYADKFGAGSSCTIYFDL